MQNSIYKIKYLLFLTWDWEAWCLTQSWGRGNTPLERNTAWNKGRKCFHCLGAPNNLIRPWDERNANGYEVTGGCTICAWFEDLMEVTTRKTVNFLGCDTVNSAGYLSTFRRNVLRVSSGQNVRHLFNSENGGNTFILKVGKFLPFYIAKHSRKMCSLKEKRQWNTTQEAEKVYTPLKCSGNYIYHLL